MKQPNPAAQRTRVSNAALQRLAAARRSLARPAVMRRAMASSAFSLPRRSALVRAVAGAALLVVSRLALSAERFDASFKPERRWIEAAASMKRLAESWGDQAYGAVLVADGAIVGEGPSRVVKRGDPTAHAEREAIRDAQRRLGRMNLAGSILYSTSRPCSQCEMAAAEAHVARMIFGEGLSDAGQPRP